MNILNLFRRPRFLKSLSPQELAFRMEDFSKPVIVDVRTAFEFKSGHIAEAMNFPLGSELKATQKNAPNTPVILIRKTGHRSQCRPHTAEKWLHQPYQLDGGIDRWRKENYPVEK